MAPPSQDAPRLDLLGPTPLQSIVEEALRAMRARNVILALYDEEISCLTVSYVAGVKEPSFVGKKLAINDEYGIVSYVAATGETFVTGDVRNEPRYRKLFEHTVSEAAAPVLDRFGRVIGVLNVESDQVNAFSDEEKEKCKSLATLAALVLELGSKQARESALIKVGQAIALALSEEALIGMVIDVAGEVLHFQAASIFIRDPDSNLFVLQGSTSWLKSKVGEIKYGAGEGCTGWVCGTGKPILLQNPQADSRWRGLYVEFPSDQISGFLCVPLLINGRPEGAIRILRKKAENPFLEGSFTEDDLVLMEAIAGLVSSGLQNIRNVDRMISSERMIAWGELSAKSSHMIGNRLFAVKGDLNELNYLLESPETTQEAVIEIASSLEINVQRIEEILQDFRDFLSATQLHKTVFDLNGLVESTVREVFPKRSQIKLQVNLADRPLVVEADTGRLQRAISELIENSLPYALEGTSEQSLSVTTRFQSKDNGLEFAELTVSDRGPGVREEEKEKIFQPFFTGRAKGMGLGLSIVKGIVEAHGGSIEEIGVPGSGATFVIRLPLLKRP